jgi:hypothetical protein
MRQRREATRLASDARRRSRRASVDLVAFEPMDAPGMLA